MQMPFKNIIKFKIILNKFTQLIYWYKSTWIKKNDISYCDYLLDTTFLKYKFILLN